MKPSSAKIIEKRQYRDKHGVSRYMKLRECDCGTREWLGKVSTPKCSKCRDWSVPDEQKKKISNTLKNKYKDPAYKERILSTFRPPKGEEHWNWKGGVSSDRVKIYNTPEYTSWRTEVFKRDKYQCRMCKTKGQLHAHHIVPWAADPSLGLAVTNGMTLCTSCHVNVHRYYKEVCNQSPISEK